MELGGSVFLKDNVLMEVRKQANKDESHDRVWSNYGIGFHFKEWGAPVIHCERVMLTAPFGYLTADLGLGLNIQSWEFLFFESVDRVSVYFNTICFPEESRFTSLGSRENLLYAECRVATFITL